MYNKDFHIILLEKELRKKNNLNFMLLKQKVYLEDDEDLMKILLYYLESHLEDLDLNSNHKKNKILGKVLSYIKYNSKKIEIKKETYQKIADDLNSILEQIDFKINNKKTILNYQNYTENTKLLFNLKENITEYISKLDKEGYNNFNRIETYNFMIENINVKTPFLIIDKIIKNYPSIVNLKNKDESLINYIANKYINSIKLENKKDYDDILYYQKIIISFLSCPVFNQDLQKTESILFKCIDLVNKSNWSISEKQGILLLQKEIFNNIHIVKENLDKEYKIRKNTRLKYQLCTDFNVFEMDEINKINLNFNKKGYKNHRDLYTITIDPEDTTRFEDALFYKINDDESVELTLYTPAVFEVIKPDSLLEERAEKRALKYFLPDDIIHKYFSFDEGGDRLAVFIKFYLIKIMKLKMLKSVELK